MHAVALSTPGEGRCRQEYFRLDVFDGFYGDVDARIPVGVVLVLARTALEPLLVVVRQLRLSAHRTLRIRLATDTYN
jgi:hypothetical protein